MITTVDVTTPDIRHGVAQDCEECPVAQALERVVRADIRLAVRSGFVTFYQTPGDSAAVSIALPWAAREFVERFDEGLGVEPLTFELDIPPEFLREVPA